MITANLNDIIINTPNEISFNLINDTSEPINIESFSASCGCTSPSISVNPVLPNSTSIFQLIFTPSQKGKHHKSAQITVNGETTTFYINATVI